MFPPMRSRRGTAGTDTPLVAWNSACRVCPSSPEAMQMSEAISAYSVEERVVQGETVWVAIRARGAEWSWLTPAEAARLGRQWVEKYGDQPDGAAGNDEGAARTAFRA